MTYQEGDDALAHAIMRVQDYEHSHGGHSWGYAYIDDGEIVMDRGIGLIPDDMDIPVVDQAIVHTRLATRGEITLGNAHPFPITKDGETVAVIVHNGTWIDAPPVSGWSDTRTMAKVISLVIDKHSVGFDRAMKSIAERTGETFIVLHRSGDVYVNAGRYPITRTSDVVASSGYKRMTPGRLWKNEQIIYDDGNETLRKYISPHRTTDAQR